MITLDEASGYSYALAFVIDSSGALQAELSAAGDLPCSCSSELLRSQAAHTPASHPAPAASVVMEEDAQHDPKSCFEAERSLTTATAMKVEVAGRRSLLRGQTSRKHDKQVHKQRV